MRERREEQSHPELIRDCTLAERKDDRATPTMKLVVGRFLKLQHDNSSGKAARQITRLDIARFARVDPALIRYYFGDKSTLLTTLAVQMIEELLERLAPLLN